MRKILLIRHAETKENHDRIVQRHGFGTISEKGYEQIARLEKRLANENISLILSSDIDRCVTTTEKLQNGMRARVIYTELLREKDASDFAGRKHSEVDWSELKGEFETKKPNNGESLLDVKARAKEFIKLLKSFDDDTIMIISHDAFLKILVGQLINLPLKDSIFSFKFDNCSISIINIEGSNYRITSLNDTNHL